MDGNITTLTNHGSIMFSWYDYLLFVIVLGASCGIGIYFGFFGKKQNNKQEYLFGGRQMSVWPIAISLIASHTSGITVLGIPADTYRYGAGYGLSVIATFALHFITCYIFLPVFYKLEITSTYEYLALRFDEKTRMLASFLYAIGLFLYLPLVIYLPALGFSAATGISVHLITPVACGICIFYTTIGGLKAVVWTDTLQFCLTIGCLGIVLYVALQSAGGFFGMWQIAQEGHRLDLFDFDLDPTKRDSFWIVVTGLLFVFTAQNSVNQGSIQKFLSLPSLSKAKWTSFIFCSGYIITKIITVTTGLCMYAIFAKCDPFSTKQVSRNDQLVPYFVMKISKDIPGLSGLFISGVFCAALSTLSANLNCVAGTLYTDFVAKWTGPKTTDETINSILKLLVVIVGVLCVLMVFVVEHLGGVLKLAISLKGIADGPLLGIFTMGVLCRRFNAKGAFYGSLIGVFTMAWYFCTVKYYETQSILKDQTKPLSTEGCSSSDFSANITHLLLSSSNLTTPIPTNDHEEIFVLFRISFYLYTLMGTCYTMLVGYIISIVTSDDKPLPSRKLMSPLVHFMLPEEEDDESSRKINNGDYYSVDQALRIVNENSEKQLET